jgi:hypothetical protein
MFLRACDLGKMPGAERVIARVLESFDQCVAAHDLLGLQAHCLAPPRR